MPKIKPIVPKEGDVITKESLIDFSNEIENIDTKIDQDNIREEGLDWRVFDDGVTVEHRDLHKGPVTTSKNLRISHNQFWTVPTWPSGSISGGYNSTTPRIDFEWDPEKDTDIIIRCSLQATSNAAGKKRSHIQRTMEAWEFGLYIIPPGSPTVPPARPTQGFPVDIPHMVFPSQRMMLNGAFSTFNRRGHSTRNEWYGEHDTGLDELRDEFGEAPDETSFRIYDYLTAKTRLQEFDTWGQSDYPAGQWDQYGYDRSSRMAQSFTLVAHASSHHERYLPPNMENLSVRKFLKAGTGKAYLVYRSFYTHPALSSGPVYYSNDNPSGGTLFDNTESGMMGIDCINMSYQIIRR